MYYECTQARIFVYVCMYVCMYVLYLLPSLSLLFDLPCVKSIKGMLPHTHTYLLYIHTIQTIRKIKPLRGASSLPLWWRGCGSCPLSGPCYWKPDKNYVRHLLPYTYIHLYYTYIHTYNNYLIRQIVHTYNSRNKIIRWWI